MTTPEPQIHRPPGRPRGSGAHTLRLVERSDQGGYRLLIGRALWQAIGEPARVDLARGADGRLRLTPGAAHTVAGQSVNGQPRISLSQPRVEELALPLAEPIVARVQDGAIVIGGPAA